MGRRTTSRLSCSHATTVWNSERMKMRAALVHEIAGPVVVTDVEVPRVPDDAVLVEVRATGLCRSDWHAWAGHDDISLPHVPGHEFAGTVAAVGVGVTRWQVGDRVTMPFVEGCGACEWCDAGEAQVCPDQEQPGFTHWGSFAQFVVALRADTNLVAIPDGVAFEAAAGLGCRFATAFRALTSRAAVRPGEWVCVVGAGGVGLSAVMIAKALGARVVAVDRNAEALAAALRHCAEAVVEATDGVDVAARVHDITSGGAHVAVDAVGSESTCSDGLHALRRRGRHVQVGLLPPVIGHPRLPMSRVIAWELDVLGSHGMSARDYPAMLALVADGTLDPGCLVARTVSLDEAATMLPTMDSSTLPGVTIIDPQR